MILVIDKNRSILRAFEIVLQRENFSISTSTHPEEAINLISNLKPEVVILDIKIDSSDGINTIITIKNVFPNLPVFIMTAYSNIITRQIAKKLGADEYFMKPFKIDQLLKKLKELVQPQF